MINYLLNMLSFQTKWAAVAHFLIAFKWNIVGGVVSLLWLIVLLYVLLYVLNSTFYYLLLSGKISKQNIYSMICIYLTST